MTKKKELTPVDFRRRFWRWFLFSLIMLTIIVFLALSLAGYRRLEGKKEYARAALLVKPLRIRLNRQVLTLIRRRRFFNFLTVEKIWFNTPVASSSTKQISPSPAASLSATPAAASQGGQLR